MKTLEGKVGVITGGNSGIGFAAARAFVDAGARVSILGRNAESLTAAVAELGSNAHGVQGDVTQLADLDRLVSETQEKWGGVDAVFVNAGVASLTPIDATAPEDFDRLIDVNVKGAFFTIQKLLPILNDGASIVLNASVAGQIGMPAFSVYSATKAAVRSLARSLSAELVERGIRVNVISPGPIETPLFDRFGMPQAQLDEMAQQILAKVPLKRMGRPEEVANAVLFLASPESAYVVGAELEVDGGMSQL